MQHLRGLITDDKGLDHLRSIGINVAFMEYKLRITSIKARAEAIGLPIRELCLASKLNPSTLHRWEQDDANPRMRDLLQTLVTMEAVLAERERKIVVEVASRTPQVVLEALSAAKAPAAA